MHSPYTLKGSHLQSSKTFFIRWTNLPLLRPIPPPPVQKKPLKNQLFFADPGNNNNYLKRHMVTYHGQVLGESERGLIPQ